jgi:murein DD-endopeptidase MepM/ murein hydrolase activator NlpD/soluble lytic murein transglycosylase-like protein
MANQFTPVTPKGLTLLGSELNKFLNLDSVEQAFTPFSQGGLNAQTFTPAAPLPSSFQNRLANRSTFSPVSSLGAPAESLNSAPGSSSYFSSVADRFSSFNEQAQHAQQARWQSLLPFMSRSQSAISSAPGAPAASLNPQVDAWNADFAAGSQRFGTPINLAKSLMNLESGGANLGANGAGAGGPMQIVGSIWGDAARSLGLDLNNPHDNVQMGMYILSTLKNDCGSWEGAVNSYYTGSCQSTGAHDDPSQGGSGMSDYDYVKKIIDGWHSLDSRAGAMSAQSPSPGSSSFGVPPLSAYTGGIQASVSQEFGPTQFALDDPYNYYGYAKAYGVNGHPGIDYNVPRGTPLTTPFSGTVVCVGGNSYGSDLGGGDCSGFADSQGGVGRLQIRLDNGDHLILGHASRSAVTPGQRVNAGDLIGYSGGENGDHVHIEYRKKTPGATSSGFTAVDVRTMTANYTQGSGYGSGQAMTPAQQFNSPTPWGGGGYNPSARGNVRQW